MATTPSKLYSKYKERARAKNISSWGSVFPSKKKKGFDRSSPSDFPWNLIGKNWILCLPIPGKDFTPLMIHPLRLGQVPSFQEIKGSLLTFWIKSVFSHRQSELCVPQWLALSPCHVAPLVAGANFFLCHSQPLSLAFIYNSEFFPPWKLLFLHNGSSLCKKDNSKLQ